MFFLMAFFLFLGLVVPHFVSAQIPDPSLGLESVASTGLGTEDIRIIIARIIRAVLGFMGITVLVLMIYAGYTIMTAAGNEQKIETGKKILINASVGLAIILSSFAITTFIIAQLIAATNGLRLRDPRGGILAGNTFAGSGSLGGVIRDHYPFRDQTNVARNTKISVTFNIPIEPTSIFDDSNGNGTRGDCTDTATFSWNTNCDHLIAGSVVVTAIDETGAHGPALDMAAMGTYDAEGEVRNLVLRPIQSLGSDSANVKYSVVLTSAIRQLGSTESIFASDSSGEYNWEFETGTEFDLTPPRVVSIYPRQGTSVARNTVLQINFSEAVDPVVAQGRTGTFYNIIFGNAAITGVWRLSNGYKTVEFVSSQACGENSCGQPMFCLPSGCAQGDEACSEAQKILVSTAELMAVGSFEGRPFDGITDMSGNALDGDGDNVADNRPTRGSATVIEAAEEVADNYVWNFNVQNIIDRSAPYIIQVSPGIDMDNVDERAEHYILFSKPMWMSTFDQIAVTEYGLVPPRSFWIRPTAQINASDETKVSLGHRVYGPDNTNVYYFTSIPEGVKSLNQNCVYPGYGPYSGTNDTGASPECRCDTDINGLLDCSSSDTNCVQADSVATLDTGCAQNDSAADLLKGDVVSCLDRLNDADLSPPL